MVEVVVNENPDALNVVKKVIKWQIALEVLLEAEYKNLAAVEVNDFKETFKIFVKIGYLGEFAFILFLEIFQVISMDVEVAKDSITDMKLDITMSMR